LTGLPVLLRLVRPVCLRSVAIYQGPPWPATPRIDPDLRTLAQARMKQLEIPLARFDFVEVRNMLIASGAYELCNADGDTEPVRQRAAVNDLLFTFMKARFYRDLALARQRGLRCTPLFPFGSMWDDLRHDYYVEVLEDLVETDDGIRSLNGIQLASTFVVDNRGVRDDLTNKYVALAEYENPRLLENIEDIAAFRQNASEHESKIIAAVAAAYSYIHYDSLLSATTVFRNNSIDDKLLSRTPLARVTCALYDYARFRIEEARMRFDAALLELRPDRYLVPRDALLTYVAFMKAVISGETTDIMEFLGFRKWSKKGHPNRMASRVL
jgi:hypothetical protein